jgi:hypothetical protein
MHVKSQEDLINSHIYNVININISSKTTNVSKSDKYKNSAPKIELFEGFIPLYKEH